MKTWLKNIFIFIFMLQSCLAFSQKDCAVPVSPVLNLVSVQPETGYVELSWSPSSSTDIAAYIIYNHNSGYWITVDTIWDPAATSYLYESNGTKYFSESYVVAAFRKPVCTSPLSNILSTIFCTASVDTCKKQIKVKWNKYSNNPARVEDYRILISKNGSPLTTTYTADSTLNSFIITDFEANTNYNFAVMAELEGGITSSSRKSDTLSTKMQRPPQWINADYATVNNDRKIDLSFTYDPLSEITSFNLEKKTGSSGVYQVLAHLTSSTGRMNYTDNPDIRTVNYYRVSAINNCSLPAIYSNPASNMVLSEESVNDKIYLKWNPYRKWNGIINEYLLLVNTGNGMTERSSLSPNDTTLKINYSDYMYEVTGKDICFMIEAVEASNPYGVTTGRSYSSSICTTVTENISVPNTLIPNPVNPVNATFKPVLSFTPSDYRLVITDLRRKTLFETNDYEKVWDGTVNGKVLPAGVYLWFLRVSTPSGRTISKTGTINIIFNR